MGNLSRVVTCLDTNPRENLGPRWTSTDSEKKFVYSFIHSYDKYYPSIHRGSKKLNRVMAREVSMNGLGIADLVTVSWDSHINICQDDSVINEFKPTVRSFEFKLSDWRKGLMQANRYRFFSDAAILVVPEIKLGLACKYLDTFEKINVGLWGYNQIKETITVIQTPRPRKPANLTYREKAVKRVLESATITLPTA